MITESDNVTVKRGDIYYADLSPVVGSEQGGLRPEIGRASWRERV